MYCFILAESKISLFWQNSKYLYFGRVEKSFFWQNPKKFCFGRVYILVTNVGQHSTQSCTWCGSRSIIEAECCDWVLPSIGHRGHKVIFLLSFPLHCANPASILTESKKDKKFGQKAIKKWGNRKNRAASIV